MNNQKPPFKVFVSHIYYNIYDENLQHENNAGSESCYDIKIASPHVRIGQCLEADNPSGHEDLLKPRKRGIGLLPYTPNPNPSSGKEAKAEKPHGPECRGEEGESRRGDYLDIYNKLNNGVSEGASELDLQRVGKEYNKLRNCGKWYREGVCQNGHSVFRVISCMKEYCPSCGRKGSVLHKQRVFRWIGKAIYMYREAREQGSYVGYMVFTLPSEIRAWLLENPKRANKFLRAFENYIRRKLQRQGVKRGLMRWHWMGDKNEKRYHPHLNVLYAGRYYWSKDELQAWRNEIIAWIEKYTGVKCRAVDIYNSYVKSELKIWHKVKYICRPTLKRADLEDFCKGRAVVFGFQTWDAKEMKRIKQEIGIIEAGIQELYIQKHFEKGLCPICEEKLIWGRPQHIDNMPFDVCEISEGLYVLRSGGWEQLKLFKGG